MVRVHLSLGTRQSKAISFGAFRLADDGVEQPQVDLRAALAQLQVDGDQFWIPDVGESRYLAISEHHGHVPRPRVVGTGQWAGRDFASWCPASLDSVV